MTRIGTIRCLLAAVLFGASAPAASRLAGDTGPLVLAGLLYLGAAMAVLPSWLRHPPSRQALRSSWRPITVAVVFGGAVGPTLLVAGLARTDAATASILLNLELVATVVLAALFFREHLGRNVIGGAALIATGGALLVWAPGAQLDPGALLIAGACLCWGLDNCVTAGIDHVAPEHVVFLKGVVAGTASLILGLAFRGQASGGGLSAREVLAALVIGMAGYGLSITLWVKGARDLGAARGQLLFATAPFVGAAISWIVLAEPMTMTQLVAVALAAAGVSLAFRSAHLHEHRHEPLAHDHEHIHDDGHHDHPHDAPVGGRHTHPHSHQELMHAHPHVPDLHHRHRHP